MGYVDPRDIPRRTHFIYGVSDLEYAYELKKKYSRARMHLFFDTGMHREGMSDIHSVLAQSILKNIAGNIEGVMSHLATPDDIPTTEIQLQSFQSFRHTLASYGITPSQIHICASG